MFRIRKIVITLYFILLVGVLLAKVSDWFINYSKEVDQVITTSMFCLIGIAYIWQSFSQTQNVYKVIYFVCGAFVIGMNFIERDNLITIIGIACIITPMILNRFKKNKLQEV